MTESILNTIKKLIGLDISDDSFNTDLIIHINSVIFILRQLGVGPENGFSIDGDSETWSDYLGEDIALFELVKSYIYLKTRLVFDPPTNGAIMESVKSAINECEFRLNIERNQYSENENE